MISDLAFEQISGKYYYAAYGPFRVIMDKSNGYINATKMCISGGKDYKDWSRQKGAQALIQTLETMIIQEDLSGSPELTLGDSNVRIPTLRSSACKVVHTFNVTDEERLISGTYVHLDLIPSI